MLFFSVLPMPSQRTYDREDDDLKRAASRSNQVISAFKLEVECVYKPKGMRRYVNDRIHKYRRMKLYLLLTPRLSLFL